MRCGFHATHKTSPLRLTRAIPTYMEPPVESLRAAIKAKGTVKCARVFDALTAACNGCHVATEFGFNVVVRPQVNTFANQDFNVPGK